MSFNIPGLGGNGQYTNGSMEADAGFFVQQLLDQVQQNGSMNHTPIPQATPAAQQEIVMKEEYAPQPSPSSFVQPSLQPPSNNSHNATPDATAGAVEEIEVPQCLIYGGETGPDEFVIPGSCLQKLPKEALANLFRDGERMGSLHRLGSTPNWESLVRLKQYLDQGEYKPFKPATPIEYLDSSGNAHAWNSRDSPNAVEVPKATYELFLREIDFYLFAAQLGFAELRKTCAERLCSRYPKSTEGIMLLVEKTGSTAVHNEDRGLIQKIIQYINTNCRELTGMPQFLTLLRKLTKGKPPLGAAMLEAYFSASEAIRREASAKGINSAVIKTEVSTPSFTPASGVNAIGSTSASSPSDYVPPPRTNSSSSKFNTPLAASEISNLVEALNRQCLVVANDNGYGTLVREGRKGRNTDFKFLKGEIMVADRLGDTVNGRHNISVMNSRGEQGDILRTLVKKVPPGLGVLAADNAVNDGKATPNRFPDREERNFAPFPSPPNRRGRSRSPPRNTFHYPNSHQWRAPTH